VGGRLRAGAGSEGLIREEKAEALLFFINCLTIAARPADGRGGLIGETGRAAGSRTMPSATGLARINLDLAPGEKTIENRQIRVAAVRARLLRGAL
jgi:hypothetical protein